MDNREVANAEEYNYLQLLKLCITEGTRQKNRTGIDTRMIPGAMLQFNLESGFPLLTTKRMAFKQIKGEFVGFLRGYTNAAQFRELGCTIWDANANENEAWLKNPYRHGKDHLGPIYGAQWRSWPYLDDATGTDKYLDQLATIIEQIVVNPTSRRLVVSAWNPPEIPMMALPPCHLLFQFLVEQRRTQIEPQGLNLCMYMRSADMFLGVPFNIASYGLMLYTVAKIVGMRPGLLTIFMADCHVYENHISAALEQIARPTRPFPHLADTMMQFITRPTVPQITEQLASISPEQFHLHRYEPHPAISAPMAV